MRGIYGLVILANAAALVGCVDELPRENSTDQHAETHNRLAGNRLAGNRLAAAKLAGTSLTTERLVDDTFMLNDTANELLAQDGGAEVLTYIVSCALPAGVLVVGADGFSAFGSLGVAPQWMDKALDDKGVGWVSACLYSRVNFVESAVQISLRGSNPALATDPQEVADYPLEEGAFYGNYFTAEGPAIAFACSGRDQASSTDRFCAGPAGPGSFNSVCDPTEPGLEFYYTGTCFDDPTVKGQSGACNKDSGIYGNCSGLSKRGGPYHQVITSYLAQ